MFLFDDNKLLKEPSNLSPLEFDQYFLNHYDFIIGIDEVGRGCLAGPVVSAAVILPTSFLSSKGLNDSKKLSTKQKNTLFQEIYSNALYCSIGMALPYEIDTINIYQASKLSMLRTLDSLPSQFLGQYSTAILIDAIKLKYFQCHIYPIIKGDTKSPHIMSASIIAKVTRDHLMELYHSVYPEYHFHKHKGYATKEHLISINKHGISAIHRKSFRPCKT